MTTEFKYVKDKTAENYFDAVCQFTNDPSFQRLEVEQSEVDGRWYLPSECPHKTPAQEAQERQEAFERDFFNIPSFGWYRKKPKGYSSAVESLNTAFNAVTIMQQLPEGMLIFYAQPDFTDPTQCTEEWLVAHQTFNEVMTAQEFGQFYITFMTAWNTQEHVNEVEE